MVEIHLPLRAEGLIEGGTWSQKGHTPTRSLPKHSPIQLVLSVITTWQGGHNFARTV